MEWGGEKVGVGGVEWGGDESGDEECGRVGFRKKGGG